MDGPKTMSYITGPSRQSLQPAVTAAPHANGAAQCSHGRYLRGDPAWSRARAADSRAAPRARLYQPVAARMGYGRRVQ